jgi:hypothetical protein
MSHTKALLGSLSGVAAVIALTPALAGATAPDPASGAVSRAEGTTLGARDAVRERGNLIECTGRYRGTDTFVSVYENNRYTNVLQVVVGDGGAGASREVAEGFVDGSRVHGALRLQGKKVTVSGTAVRTDQRTKVHEEHDDAGQHIVIDGYHRALDSDLTMSWQGTTIRLTCDNAFYYNLKVVKSDITAG